MSRSSKMIKGTLILSLAGIITKILGMFFRLPLVRMTGDIGNGHYQTVYSVFLIVSVISLVGIPQSVSRTVSNKITNNKEEEAYEFFQVAFALQIVLGIIISSIIFFGAKYWIRILGWEEEKI